MSTSNNFNLLRLCLAVIVCLSHIGYLSGKSELIFLTYLDTDFAVKGFFVISGYLVYQSYVRSKTVWLFYLKRAARLLPLYFFVIITSAIIGSFFTKLTLYDYFTDMNLYRYLAYNLLTLNFLQPDLPGLFSTNVVNTVNGSLWTIKIEVMFYLVLPLLARFKSLYSKLFLIFLSALYYFYFSEISQMGYAGVLSRQLPAQLPYFLFGIWLSSARISQLNYSLLILVSIIFYIVGYRVINHHFIEYPKWLFYPLFIISVASIKSRVNNALGDIDISYGVYLWHFPIAQLFSQWGEYIDVQLYISSVLALTLILAYGSWIFIERPIIRYIRNHIYNATH